MTDKSDSRYQTMQHRRTQSGTVFVIGRCVGYGMVAYNIAGRNSHCLQSYAVAHCRSELTLLAVLRGRTLQVGTHIACSPTRSHNAGRNSHCSLSWMGKFKTFTVEESVHLICNIVNKSVVYKGGDLCYKFWNGLSINILFILVFCIRGEIVHTRPYVVLCGIRWVKAGTIILCFTTTLKEST